MRPSIKELIVAARLDDAKAVQSILRLGVPVDSKLNGCTALLAAATCGSLNVVKLLIDAGAGVNIVNDDGASPLYCAAANTFANSRYYMVVKLLLDAGGRVDDPERRWTSWTPLMAAVANRNVTLTDLLLAHHARTESRDCSGNTALILALCSPIYITHVGPLEPNVKVVRALVGHGAKIDVHNAQGQTPLSLANSLHNREMLKILRQSRVR